MYLIFQYTYRIRTYEFNIYVFEFGTHNFNVILINCILNDIMINKNILKWVHWKLKSRIGEGLEKVCVGNIFGGCLRINYKLLYCHWKKTDFSVNVKCVRIHVYRSQRMLYKSRPLHKLINACLADMTARYLYLPLISHIIS